MWGPPVIQGVSPSVGLQPSPFPFFLVRQCSQARGIGLGMSLGLLFYLAKTWNRSCDTQWQRGCTHSGVRPREPLDGAPQLHVARLPRTASC